MGMKYLWIRESKAIFFDFGMTLFNFSGNTSEFAIREIEFLHKILAFLEPEFEKREQLIRIFKKVYQDHISGNNSKLRDFPDLVPRFRDAILKSGYDLPDLNTLYKISNKYGNFRFSPQTLTPFGETRNILKYFSNGGVRMIITSNIPSRGRPKSRNFVEKILEYYQMSNFFEKLIYSGDVGYLKPHSEIFKVGQNHLELEPHQILHIGDDWNADIVGAKNMGWKTLWISHGKSAPQNSKAADMIVSTLGQICGVFRNL